MRLPIEHDVPYLESAPAMHLGWEAPPWNSIPSLLLACFADRGSDHRPRTRAKLCHTNDAIHVFFLVEDRYVVARHDQPQSSVCKDSCVEFFLQPQASPGYFNVEINCGGTPLVYFIEDATRTDAGFARYQPLTVGDLQRIPITTSMPRRVEPEIARPTRWSVRYALPRELLETYAPPLGPWHGQTWHANLYKCADACSHPHWASWAPLPKVDFHQPACFGKLHLK